MHKRVNQSLPLGGGGWAEETPADERNATHHHAGDREGNVREEK